MWIVSYLFICCCCSVAKSCQTLCDPMDCRMPAFPVLHYLPEFAEIHVHWIGDAIQPSHPLPASSPFAKDEGKHHSSKASILRCSAFFIVQLSHPNMQPLTPPIKLFVLCSFDTDYRSTHLAIPGSTRGKEPTCLCRGHKRHMFDPWVGKISWRRPWQPIPVFLSGEFHGQRSLVGYSPWGHKGLDTTEAT